MKKGAYGSVLLCALLATPIIGMAQEPNEIAGRFSYSDVSFGDVDAKETELVFSYGRYLTDAHQVGVSVGYNELEADGSSVDGSSLGGFYTYNFVTPGIYTPFLGVNFDILGGDIGDFYDFGYGVSVGLKIYPFQNAGFLVGVAYQELSGKDGVEDADGFNFEVGLLIRF